MQEAIRKQAEQRLKQKLLNNYDYLCRMQKKETKGKKVAEVERPVDRYFRTMDQTFVQGSKLGYAVSLSLLFFGIMGLIWMIPFPQFDFLVRMNMHTFLNWGSLFIAIVIYLYLRLAPTLSYAILFSIAIMSFFIVQLEYIERAGGPAVWLVALVLAVLGFLGLFLLTRKEEKSIYGQELSYFICFGPIWLWSKVFKKLNIKF